MEKRCPFLKAVDPVAGNELCRENCALYVKIHNSPHGCAFEVIAMALAAISNGYPVRATLRNE